MRLNNPQNVASLISILQTSSGNLHPLTSTQIELALNSQFGFPLSGNQQSTRALIKYTISQGYVIKSSTANPPGYWLSTDKDEIIQNIKSLEKRALKIIENAYKLKVTWNNLHQTNLIK